MRVTALFAFALAVALPAQAGELEDSCRNLGLLVQVCDASQDTEFGASRQGVSYADRTDDSNIIVEIADFYFSPRVLQIFEGQRVIFRNSNPKGGNRHSLTSSDLGGKNRVLPVPGSGFREGQAFTGGLLKPGDTFVLDTNLAIMDPVGYLPTGLGDQWIGYHCYVHGASQMSGLIRVLPRI